MNLSERLNEDMKQAMRSKDKFKLSTIRMVRSTIKNLEIDLKRSLDDNEVLDIFSREIKQRKDALQEFEKAGRDDLAADAKAEIELLSAYLPEQLTEEEIKVIVQQTIQETGASSKAEMGKVMSALMPKVKGRADGKLVNQVVQRGSLMTISARLCWRTRLGCKSSSISDRNPMAISRPAPSVGCAMAARVRNARLPTGSPRGSMAKNSSLQRRASSRHSRA